MPPEASWTAIRSPRTSTRGVGFLLAALLPGTPCTGGNFPLPICWVCRLETVYGIADGFFRMKGYAGAGWGFIQGKRVAGKPLSNRRRTCRENRRKTVGKPLENRWETAGKPLENRRKNAGKMPGKAPFLGDFCQSQ